MGKCLTTTYNETVNKDSLLKAGEMRIVYTKIENPSEDSQTFIIKTNKDVSLKIIGNGYFTDSTLTQNYGKTKVVKANTLTTLYSSNGDYSMCILDKYSINTLEFRSSSLNKSIQLDDLTYSTKVSYLVLRRSAKVSGNLSSISNMENMEGILISEGYSITGDISALHNIDTLINLNLYKSSISGDIAGMPKKYLGSSIYILGKDLYGDISVLYNYSNLNSCTINGNLTGDLAKLPSGVMEFYTSKQSSFTWTDRPTSSNIIAISSCFLDKVDTMLINQAQCQVPKGSTNTKTISVKGTRTSASDAAVATLQSKGYTVSITPV